MKRLLFGLAFAGGFALSLVATKHLVPTDAVRGELIRTLSAYLGTPIALEGSTEVSVFPTLKVRFRDARLASGDGSVAAEMSALVVRLDVLSLLIGDVAVSEIALRDPVVHLARRLDVDGLVPNRKTLAQLTPARIVVENGRVEVGEPGRDVAERLDAITASFVWPREKSGASLDAAFRWRGEPITLALHGLGPRALSAGDAGSVALTLTSAPLRVAFDGKGMIADMLQLDGAIEASSPDLAKAWRLFGRDLGSTELLRNFSIAGRMRSLGFAATLSNAAVAIDGNKGEGVVSVRLDAVRPQIRGTLALDTLDITRYVARLAATDWRTVPTDRPALGKADLDLRLSASQVKAGAARLERVAAALLVKDGRIDAELGEATLAGGSVRAILRGEPKADGLRATGRIAVANASAGGLAAVVGLAGVEDGRLSLTVEGESSAADLDGLLAGVSGRFSGEGRAVSLKGMNAVASGARYLPIAQKTPVASGAATFDKVALEGNLSGRLLQVRRIDADGAALAARLSGEASLATGLLSLRGQLSLPEAGTRETTRRVTLPIRIGGTIAEPVTAIDTAARPTFRP